MGIEVTRRQVLDLRVRAQQLDRPSGTLADTAVLDIGVQDTGADGALWALAIRGVDAPPAGKLATVWTIRGAPHVYRRSDLAAVATATAPFSDADAGKRIFDASKPLKAAGIPNLAGLDVVADAMRSIVREPMVKGEMSTRLTVALPEPYLRFCVPCNAIHSYEQPFRLAALRAGLELEPGTSPPVLRPVPGLTPAEEVPDRLDVVRAYLRLLGPATPQHVAGYLDAPVKDIKARWPADAVEVLVDGERRWLLADDVDRLDDDPAPATRLLGPFDLYLQARDRPLLVDDTARAKDLWRVLGRPGGVLVDGEIAGTWRARKSGSAVAVSVELWSPVPPENRTEIGGQAERLAAFRGISLKNLEITD
ncbi:winged helix DNA-binding domain-containing protein [Blastococcus sp. CT_GayMR16]|uniref:winged helix DNA-binding domain-containing protein n=1 Tax=Blastococcus sp. CT_GayMR16 TaxID=2559607 RepID=UPI0010745AD3|nr:winged helix DNA-binding domain-containing protein [Blastococcus sp. CT_GayMR16]TFV86284.1 winged helix DNA-binding domain-containing protein [Blastococcus sp. CT_GayMR16]